MVIDGSWQLKLDDTLLDGGPSDVFRVARDRAPIPERDLPAGAPPWMRSLKQWASRQGDSAEDKRAQVLVRIPPKKRPWR